MMKRIDTFSELAKMYFPNCSTSKNAVRCLNRYIQNCKLLVADLAMTGFAPYTHRHLTPKQFSIIISHLGDPFDD